MSRVAATRRASSTASSEQQPRSRSRSRSRGHIARVIPNDRRPEAAHNAAATDESTPPDMATAMTASSGSSAKGSSGTCAGTLPVAAATAAAVMRCGSAAAGDGGHDRQLVTIADGGLEALLEPDVGVVDVDVDELAQAAVGLVQAITEP